MKIILTADGNRGKLRNRIPVSALDGWLFLGGLLEILFFLRWYHFRNFPRLPSAVRMIFMVIFGVAVVAGYFGEGMSILFGLYLFVFSQAVADQMWRWGIKTPEARL